MSLISIGLSGLRSHQTALSVTGNNVANVSTEGYSRQQVVFEQNPSLASGAGYIGQGSSVQTVERVTQEFLVQSVRTDTSLFHERDALLNQAEQIDNLLASSTTGLSPALASFFQAMQGAAESPTSVPQRQLVLTQAEGLVSRFQALDARLNSQFENINQELEATVAEFSSIASSLANLNASIAEATGASQGTQANDLLDERDRLLLQLSELVSVSTVPLADGQVNVYIGNGQPLVIGNRFNNIETVPSQTESGRLEVALVQNGAQQIISNDINGGVLGGLIDFRENHLIPAINGLGQVAIALADTLNSQHALGMDLESELGGLFFGDVNDASIARSRVTANLNNTPPNDQVLRVNIIDSGAITLDEYELRFDGPSDTDVSIVRRSDGEVVLQGVLPGVFPASFEIDGLEIQLESGTFKVGDRFSIQPTRNGASDINLYIDRVEDLALAAPIRADADLGNTGTGVISLGDMLDVNNPLTNQVLSAFANEGQLSPPIAIRFINENLYEVLDYSDPANPVPLQPPLNNQRFISGLTNEIFTSDPGQTFVSARGPDVLTLPAATATGGTFDNGYGGQTLSLLTRDLSTGAVSSQSLLIPNDSSARNTAALLSAQPGVSANAYTQVQLSNFDDGGDGAPMEITINGVEFLVSQSDIVGLADMINQSSVLQDLNISAVSNGSVLDLRASSGEDIVIELEQVGDSVEVRKVDPYTGSGAIFDSQVLASGNGLAVGGVIDLKLAQGVSLFSDTPTVFEQAPVVQFPYTGFQFEISGQPEANDLFIIDYNAGGVSDNRNALAMAGLETQGVLAGGVNTYGESYSQVIEQIGIVTNQARLDSESAKVLLNQSEARLQSVAGVNLDEEAGRLIQFQAAYTASAQVITIAQELFDTLLSTFR